MRTPLGTYRTVTDSAKVCKSIKLLTVNRRLCIETDLTVSHLQHQNYPEREGGVVKLRILKLFYNTSHAPIEYWCYAVEFWTKLSTYLSLTSLQGRTPGEKLLGHTSDISIFRFSWYQHVWFHSPNLSFPKDKMEPEFFLKLADNTENSFAYEILSVQSYEDTPRRKNPPFWYGVSFVQESRVTKLPRNVVKNLPKWTCTIRAGNQYSIQKLIKMS